MRVPPPSVSESRLRGWQQVESSVERPFDAGILRVTAHTAVYERNVLRAADAAADTADDSHVADAADDADRTAAPRIRRFFVASRLQLTPRPPASRALWRLVADRSMAGFETELRERGFLAVDRVDERRFDVRGTEARLARYDARSRVDGVVVSVQGWLAVWPAGEPGEFLLAGGAYPTGVNESATDDEATTQNREETKTAASLSEAFDPKRFRTELFALIRATR
ncbi:hypothetical protein AUR64_11565 [Haloprofundus marisrubri]|uniref:Uncharacterized protein n=1 Tax=Haloprofundus marisrubri TaxID=1514971 RepID=A0A0W1R9V8_9EURY|nr:hypothetical protein [Haloprofundus marisrubri]KTG10216.1 hypothetical protein AUR64_11565 [Haloprofundus marisrubri]